MSRHTCSFSSGMRCAHCPSAGLLWGQSDKRQRATQTESIYHIYLERVRCHARSIPFFADDAASSQSAAADCGRADAADCCNRLPARPGLEHPPVRLKSVRHPAAGVPVPGRPQRTGRLLAQHLRRQLQGRHSTGVLRAALQLARRPLLLRQQFG